MAFLDPNLRETMGPYFLDSSYSCRWRVVLSTWRRFPTMGSPLGPGGKFSFPFLRLWIKINKTKGITRYARVTSGATIVLCYGLWQEVQENYEQEVQDRRATRLKRCKKTGLEANTHSSPFIYYTTNPCPLQNDKPTLNAIITCCACKNIKYKNNCSCIIMHAWTNPIILFPTTATEQEAFSINEF